MIHKLNVIILFTGDDPQLQGIVEHLLQQTETDSAQY